jgi:hypothetical protein
MEFRLLICDAGGFMTFKLSNHATGEMERRSIPWHILETVLYHPQQIVAERGNLKAYQSVIDFGNGKHFLLRAIVDDTVTPASVVTVYRTSKIDKYWRPS